MKLLAGLLVAAISGTAHADAEADPEAKNPDTARNLSIGGTLVPLVAIATGVFVSESGMFERHTQDDVGSTLVIGGALLGLLTPSIGQVYADHWFSRGLLLRGFGLGVAAVGALGAVVETEGCSECHVSGGSIGILAVGAALYVGGAILDITDAPDNALDFNVRHHLQFTPTRMQTPTGGATGFAVTGTF